MLEKCPNIMIQTAGTYREDFLEEIAAEVGEKRVLFASRSPVYDQEFEMARVQLAHLSESQKEKLWCTNALATFASSGPTGWARLPIRESTFIQGLGFQAPT